MMNTEEQTAIQTAPIERRGDLQKCPICGMPVDPDAYHCPHCHNYYCFHCRARLLGGEVTLLFWSISVRKFVLILVVYVLGMLSGWGLVELIKMAF